MDLLVRMGSNNCMITLVICAVTVTIAMVQGGKGINALNSTDGTYLPSQQGFDEVGITIPFSPDWDCDATGILKVDKKPNNSICFLYDGDNIVQQPIKWATLTQRLLDSFTKFIKKDTKKPFFYYFAFQHVHTPNNVNPHFAGSSQRGVFGDSLNELQWAIGEIIRILDENKLSKNTLVVFMSDHGPHIELCSVSGSAAGLKGGKSSSWEGGFRIPFIAWWPGVILPGNQSRAVISALDLLPTFASLANAELPTDRILDGTDMTDYLLGTKNFIDQIHTPNTIYMYCKTKLFAVRHGRYKIHYHIQRLAWDNETQLNCPDGMPLREWFAASDCDAIEFDTPTEPIVYDILRDPFEHYPLNISNLVISELLKEVNKLVSEKTASLQKDNFPAIMGETHPDTLPCCDPPNCECDHLSIMPLLKAEIYKPKAMDSC